MGQRIMGRGMRRTSINGVEEVGALLLLLDVCVDEERVHLGVDVLHHDLEPIETACFWYLHFSTEALDEVLIDNTIRSGEEGEDVGHEIFFVIVQSVVPVVQILRQIDLFSGPERCFGFLVHLPYLSQSSVHVTDILDALTRCGREPRGT